MRVKLKRDFSVELVSQEKPINANDVMVQTLTVELEEPLQPSESLWVVFDKDPNFFDANGITDDILAKIEKTTEYTIPIPAAIIKSAGRNKATCTFQLFVKKYYEDGSGGHYFERGSTKPFSFEVEGGLYINDDLDDIVNTVSLANVNESALNAVAKAEKNEEDISSLQTWVTAIDTDYKAMDAAISETALYAKEKADANAQDIRTLGMAIVPLQGLDSVLRELDGKVSYGKASSISVSVDPSTYIATFTLHADGGLPISKASIDLPTEELVVSGAYDEASQSIILTTKDGKQIRVPVQDLVRGLAPLDANGKIPVQYLPEGIGSGGVDVGNLEEALNEIIEIQESLISGSGSVVGGTKWYRHTYMNFTETEVIIVTTRNTAYTSATEILDDYNKGSILSCCDYTTGGRAERIQVDGNSVHMIHDGSFGAGFNLNMATLVSIEEM